MLGRSRSVTCVKISSPAMAVSSRCVAWKPGAVTVTECLPGSTSRINGEAAGVVPSSARRAPGASLVISTRVRRIASAGRLTGALALGWAAASGSSCESASNASDLREPPGATSMY